MIPVESDRTKVIPERFIHPDGSQPEFRQPQTVFLAKGFHLSRTLVGTQKVRGARYIYSDRLRAGMTSKQRTALEESLTEVGVDKNTAEYCEGMLGVALSDPNILLVHLMAGANLGNGYSYLIYGYIPLEDPEPSGEEGEVVGI